MSKMYGKVGRGVACVQTGWSTGQCRAVSDWLPGAPHRGFQWNPGQVPWHSESKVLANPSQERASNPPGLLSSLSSNLSQRHHLGKIVRRAPSISISNVKVSPTRKQLTDVCPAESVGVQAEMSAGGSWHIWGSPITPHYLAKNSPSLHIRFLSLSASVPTR